MRVEVQQNSQSNKIVDVTASEIFANTDAMAGVVSDTKHDQMMSVGTLMALHKKLMHKMSSGVEGGVVRKVRN